jgi:two-component system response regulator HydG
MSGHGFRVLVIDDDAAHRRMLSEVLSDLGIEVLEAENGMRGIDRIAKEAPDFVLLDMRMPELDGLGTLKAMREQVLTIPTVVITAHAELDDAITAIKLGARDYLRKPIDIASLQRILEKHGGYGRTRSRSHPPLPEGVVFESPLMQDVLAELARLARSNAPVLLVGETGTGKEVLADLLHRWSARSKGPLVPVNVAALPEALIETELFGHERGAFTGAERSRDGRFQEAENGTLFLDEIGEMPMTMQPKLLRALQTRHVARIGSSEEREIDFRLVSATNRDLEAEIASGGFRQDLYYRIAVLTVEIPPLRERPEDVLALARQFLAEHDGGRKRLAASCEVALLGHDWPGNVRELASTMLRAAILAPGETVLPEHLPPALRSQAGLGGYAGGASSPGASSPGASSPVDASGGSSAEDPGTRTLAELERQAIYRALEETKGNRSEAARRLGISRRKLLYRLKEYEQDS